MRPMGRRFRPRLILRRARAWTTSRSWSELRSRRLWENQSARLLLPVKHPSSSSESCEVFRLRSGRVSRSVQKNVLVKVDSSVGKLAEGSSLLELGGLLGVLKYRHSVSDPRSSSSSVEGTGRGTARDGDSLPSHRRRRVYRGGNLSTYVFVSHDRGVGVLEFAYRCIDERMWLPGWSRRRAVESLAG